MLKPTNLYKIILYIFCLSFLSETNGQNIFGFKGGLNLTKGQFEDGATNYAIRYHFGLLAQFSLDKRLYIRPELLFSQKGWKLPDNAFDKNVTIVLNYVNLPILVGYNITPKASAFIGPELGYKLSEKRIPSGAWTNLYEKFDIGLAFGCNYAITPKLGLDLRYIYGFKGLIKGPITYTDQNGNITGERNFRDGSNRVFQFSVYYNFNGKMDE